MKQHKTIQNNTKQQKARQDNKPQDITRQNKITQDKTECLSDLMVSLYVHPMACRHADKTKQDKNMTRQD